MINRLLKIGIIAICVIIINININTVVYAMNATNKSPTIQPNGTRTPSNSTSGGTNVTRTPSNSTSGGTNGTRTPSNSTSGSTTGKTSDTDSESWVSDAFSAASSFFSEDVKDEMGIIEKPLDLFSDLVKAINKILIVALAGISAISLSIVGIRYITSIADPKQQGKAKHDLHKTVKGMAYGFGAFFIWQIAMSIVRLIINSF